MKNDFTDKDKLFLKIGLSALKMYENKVLPAVKGKKYDDALLDAFKSYSDFGRFVDRCAVLLPQLNPYIFGLKVGLEIMYESLSSKNYIMADHTSQDPEIERYLCNVMIGLEAICE